MIPILREALRKDAKNSNFDNFESALYSESGSLTSKVKDLRLAKNDNLIDQSNFKICTLTGQMCQLPDLFIPATRMFKEKQVGPIECDNFAEKGCGWFWHHRFYI